MDLERVRSAAVAQTSFAPTSLGVAIRRLGFVQADPIRVPARAQDLILRHRVADYRAGDLERRYASLAIDEDFLYAYGFLPREFARLLHPRPGAKLTAFEERVLAAVVERGALHPGDLLSTFGPERVVNAWGGSSRATKVALERLHRRGFLRVVRRKSGVRVYDARAASERAQGLSPQDRLRALMDVVASVLAPVPQGTLSGIGAYIARRHVGGGANHRTAMRSMLERADIVRRDVDGVPYLFTGRAKPLLAPERVRLLAPFDPIVWDRRRFEHLWGWAYRFEAYTPAPKRVRGYYALPVLWRTSVIGWANVRAGNRGAFDVDLGYVDKEPRDRAFAAALDEEIERLRTFLMPRHPEGVRM